MGKSTVMGAAYAALNAVRRIRDKMADGRPGDALCVALRMTLMLNRIDSEAFRIALMDLRKARAPLKRGPLAAYGSEKEKAACHEEWRSLYKQAKAANPKANHSACCRFVQAHSRYKNKHKGTPFSVRNIGDAIPEHDRVHRQRRPVRRRGK